MAAGNPGRWVRGALLLFSWLLPLVPSSPRISRKNTVLRRLKRLDQVIDPRLDYGAEK
jgi:hypothetical protein